MVRRNIGGTREEDTRHFLDKMKKLSFSLEKKEKNVTLHLEIRDGHRSMSDTPYLFAKTHQSKASRRAHVKTKNK